MLQLQLLMPFARLLNAWSGPWAASPFTGQHLPWLTSLTAKDVQPAGKANHDLQLLPAHMFLSSRLKGDRGEPQGFGDWLVTYLYLVIALCCLLCGEGCSRIRTFCVSLWCLLCRAGCAIGRPPPRSPQFSVRRIGSRHAHRRNGRSVTSSAGVSEVFFNQLASPTNSVGHHDFTSLQVA